MNYAFEYGPKSKAQGLAWEDGQTPVQVEIPYNSKEREESIAFRKAFIHENLVPGTKLYLPLGSGADRFALGGYREGASVLRIPLAYYDEAWRRITGQRAKSSNIPEDVLRLIESVVGQPRRTGDKVKKPPINRYLYAFALHLPQAFYPFEEKDADIVELGLAFRAFKRFQRQKYALAKSVGSMTFDLDLVDHYGEVEAEMEHGRQILDTQIIPILLERERAFERQIAEILPRIPVYEAIFAHIPGLSGRSITPRIIASIGNILRFPDVKAMKSYGGYGLDAAGKAPKRTKGHVLPRNHSFFQAIWDWADFTFKKTHPLTNGWKAWGQMFLARECQKHGVDEATSEEERKERLAEAYSSAYRILGQRLVENLWRRMTAYELAGSPSDFVYVPPPWVALWEEEHGKSRARLTKEEREALPA